MMGFGLLNDHLAEGALPIFKAFLIGIGFSALSFLLLGLYLTVGRSLRIWIGQMKMKSLFWRDRRRRSGGRDTS
jgi:hypothetical protein